MNINWGNWIESNAGMDSLALCHSRAPAASIVWAKYSVRDLMRMHVQVLDGFINLGKHDKDVIQKRGQTTGKGPAMHKQHKQGQARSQI